MKGTRDEFGIPLSEERTPACAWVGLYQARVVRGRHGIDCEGDECKGCQPCHETHCCICGRVHVVAGACPECVASVRDDLLTIAQLCDALPTEAVHRGVHSEAAMLWGPTADPEAWNFRKMSALMGRVDAAWLEDCRDEQHPLWVLGTWEQMWREHLDQPTDLRATLTRLVDYLNARMHVMAATDEVPFEEFARDLRGCRAHVQNVLGDQAQGDRANIGCFECSGDLERKLTDHGFEDHWTCRRCRRRYTYAEYNFALRASLEAAKEGRIA